MSTKPSPVNPAWHTQPLVWLVLAIPASAVVMGAVMLTLAITSYDGLVVDDYYKRGLEINQTRARDLAAAGHRIKATIVLDRGANLTRITLSADAGFELPESIILNAFHATRSGLDTSIEARHLFGNEYIGQLPVLEAGRWNLQVEHDGWRITGSYPSGSTAPIILSYPDD